MPADPACTCGAILQGERRIEVRDAPWLTTVLFRRRLLARTFCAATYKGRIELYARVECDTPSGVRNSIDAEAWERWVEHAHPMQPLQVHAMLEERRAKRAARR